MIHITVSLCSYTDVDLQIFVFCIHLTAAIQFLVFHSKRSEKLKKHSSSECILVLLEKYFFLNIIFQLSIISKKQNYLKKIEFSRMNETSLISPIYHYTISIVFIQLMWLMYCMLHMK